MRNYFTIDGVDSRSFGVYISGQGTFKAPARAYNLITVPGRDGELVGIGNRLEPGELTYPAFIYSNFNSNIAALRAWLLSLIGYHKLIDSYHPDEYRWVLFQGPLDPDVTPRNGAAQFDITFRCNPRRYLLSGEEITTFDVSDPPTDTYIENPTLFEAQPFLRVFGAGTLGVGSDTVTITAADVYTDIDCEMMDAFKGSVNKNNNVQLSSYKFPTLPPGKTVFSLGSGITKVEVTPRWWSV